MSFSHRRGVEVLIAGSRSRAWSFVSVADIREGVILRYQHHRGSFEATSAHLLPLPPFPMPYAKLIFEITDDPSLADDVLVQWQVGALEDLDEEPRD